MPSYPLQETCLAVISGAPVLAAFFVALRIYARRRTKSSLKLDDWLVVAALALSLALIGPSVRHVKMWHVGIHIWEVPSRTLEPKYEKYYGVFLAFNLLNIPILPLAKASIILLLLRVTTMLRSVRITLFIILAFNIAACIIPWSVFIFICPPKTGNTWAPETFGGLKCVNRHQYGRMLIFVTCANLFTDLLIFPIPFLIMRKVMNVSLRARIVAIFLFTTSLTVTGIGAAKIYLSYRDRLFVVFKPDWTYPIDYCINHIENNVAIIVACIPALRGLVARWVSNARRGTTDLECQGLKGSRESPRYSSPLSIGNAHKASSIISLELDPVGRLEKHEARITVDRKRASGSTITFIGTSTEGIDAVEMARCTSGATLHDGHDELLDSPTVAAPPACLLREKL